MKNQIIIKIKSLHYGQQGVGITYCKVGFLPVCGTRIHQDFEEIAIMAYRYLVQSCKKLFFRHDQTKTKKVTIHTFNPHSYCQMGYRVSSSQTQNQLYFKNKFACAKKKIFQYINFDDKIQLILFTSWKLHNPHDPDPNNAYIGNKGEKISFDNNTLSGESMTVL